MVLLWTELYKGPKEKLKGKGQGLLLILGEVFLMYGENVHHIYPLSQYLWLEDYSPIEVSPTTISLTYHISP